MPSQSYNYAVDAADRFLADMPESPWDRRDSLTKIIIGAMIEEAEQAKKRMCPKCRTSYSNSKWGGAK